MVNKKVLIVVVISFLLIVGLGFYIYHSPETNIKSLNPFNKNSIFSFATLESSLTPKTYSSGKDVYIKVPYTKDSKQKNLTYSVSPEEYRGSYKYMESYICINLNDSLKINSSDIKVDFQNIGKIKNYEIVFDYKIPINKTAWNCTGIYNETTFECSKWETSNYTINQTKIFRTTDNKEINIDNKFCFTLKAIMNYPNDYVKYNVSILKDGVWFIIDPTFYSNSSNFENGTFYNTLLNASGFVQLNYTIGQNGSYLSNISNTGSTVTWQNISWVTDINYSGELPNNQSIESSNYFLRGANMTGNVLLLHLNNNSAYGENDTYFYDFSGSGNNGNCSGALCPNYTSGKLGSALNFGGSFDYLTLGSVTNQTLPMTMAFWVKTPNPTAFFQVVGFAGISSTRGFTITDGGRALFYIGNGIGGAPYVYFNTTEEYYDNEWHYWVLRYKGTVASIPYANLTIDGNVIPISIELTGSNFEWNTFVLGRGGYSGASFAGDIDEFAIWNRSLTNQEIDDLYKRGVVRLNLSIRSCDDASCSGESFVHINDSSPQLDINTTYNISDNRYFQFNISFESENASAFTPELYNVSVDYFIIAPKNFTMNIDYPLNNQNFSDNKPTFFYTGEINISTNETITNCSVNNTQWDLVFENASSSGFRFLNNSQIGEGIYNINASCNLSAEQRSKIVTFNMDNSPPNINYPGNLSLEYKLDILNTNFSCSDNITDIAGFASNNSINFTINSTGGLTNATLLGIGTHIINISCNDSVTHANSTLWQVFVNDTVMEFINITQPLNNSILGTNDVGYNATLTETVVGCNYSINSGANQTMTQINPLFYRATDTLSDGNYNLTVCCIDTRTNEGCSNVTIFNINTGLPKVQSNSPLTGANFTSGLNIPFNITSTTPHNPLDNCSLLHNESGSFIINQTNSSITNNSRAIFRVNFSTSEDYISWGATCCNIYAGCNSSSNNTILIDYLAPRIIAPTNATLLAGVDSLNVDFNAVDLIAIRNWTVNNSINFSINSTGGLTNATSLASGTYILNITVNDSLDNLGSKLYQVVVEGDATPPNVTWVFPTNNNIYKRQNMTFNLTATDNFYIANCSYTLNNGLTNYSMSNLSSMWNATNTSMNVGDYNVTAYCRDSSNNLNNTESVSFRLIKDVSLSYFPVEIDDVIVSSPTPVVIFNGSVNLSVAKHMTSVGVGSLRTSGLGAATRTLYLRLDVNGIILFNGSMRSLDSINDRGVFNTPINDTESVAGQNNITVWAWEPNSRPINLTSLELFFEIAESSIGNDLGHCHGTSLTNFSGTSFTKLTTFQVNTTKFNSSFMIDYIHVLKMVDGLGSVTPRCFLRNNLTNETTNMYYRFLSGLNDVGSSGVNLRTTLKTNKSHGYELWCATDDIAATKVVQCDATFYALDQVDSEGNEINGGHNHTNGILSVNVSNYLILSKEHVVANGSNLIINSVVYVNSSTGAQEGDNSPEFWTNVTGLSHTNCFHKYERSIDNGVINDIGTIKWYTECSNLTKGNTYTINIYSNVSAGENIRVLNSSLDFMEAERQNITQGVIAPLVTITYPLNTTIAMNTIPINATVSNPSQLPYNNNATLYNGTGAFNQTLLLNFSSNNLSIEKIGFYFNTENLVDGNYTINWTVNNTVGSNTFSVRFQTIQDVENPVLNITTNISVLKFETDSVQIGSNASDNGLIDTHQCNVTYPDNTILWSFVNSSITFNSSNISVVLIPNNLTTEGTYTITCSVNDTIGNTVINQTTFQVKKIFQTCPKFGYKNKSTGKIVFSVDCHGQMNVSERINIAEEIIPMTNNTVSLGSRDKVFKELFLGSSALNIGGYDLSLDGQCINFGGLTRELDIGARSGIFMDNITVPLIITDNLTVDELLLDDGGILSDNLTCTEIFSPDGSSSVEVCND